MKWKNILKKKFVVVNGGAKKSNLDIEDLKKDLINLKNEVLKNKYLKEQSIKINSYSSTTKIKNLEKVFSQNCCCCKKKIIAVNKINFALEENEKFGLLGFNGSGKTTIFKLITKELLYDSGEIILFNKESENFNSIKRNIGYCPQENIFYDELTVKRMLKIYQRLTGINLNIEELCEKLV